MKIKKHIPNAITCCNLLCGCIAIVQTFEGNLVLAAYLVGLAALFDFFDGFAARMLRIASPIGKDLDSLADMVTFGILPGFVMFQLIHMSVEFDKASVFYALTKNSSIAWLKYFAFIIPVFSAIRLAKFNNDTRQSNSFIGLPTPANAILICSFPLILQDRAYYFLSNPYALCFLAFIFSLLLISEIPLFALKFRTFSWSGNRTRYMFLGLSLILLIAFQYISIPLIIVLYILMSMNSNFFAKRKKAL